MPVSFDVYLDDVLEAIEKIEKYTKGVSFESFSENAMISDAVVRNLEVIGEAAKKIPSEIKRKYPEVEWKK